MVAIGLEVVGCLNAMSMYELLGWLEIYMCSPNLSQREVRPNDKAMCDGKLSWKRKCLWAMLQLAT